MFPFSPLRRFPTLILAIALSFTSATHASVNYKVTILTPDGATAQSYAVIPGFQGGHINGEAVVWSGASNNYTVINPAPATIYAMSNTRQAGVVYSGGNEHAAVWSGTPASMVDLHPAGWGRSFAYGVSGSQQAGMAVGGGVEHAYLWSGSAASGVDLNPAGYVVSRANGIANGKQVGSGATTTTPTHALLWKGTPQSVIDLNPPGKAESELWGTDGTRHVGWTRASGSFVRATIWNSDDPADIVDLQDDVRFTDTTAFGIADGLQAGVGFPVGVLEQHAMAWFGTAASAVDLHTFLPNDRTWVYSTVYAIASDGTIVGQAHTQSSQFAILWTPLPEPSTVLVAVVPFAAALVRRPRRPV